MSEVSREEDGEIELSLGLSLCGSFKKSKAQEQRSNSSETPLFLNRVRERETREEEGEIGERTRKREKVGGEKDPTLTLSPNVSPSPEYNSPPAPIQVVPKQYSCVPLQYPNAVPYSCVMPCWAPISGNGRSEACVILPAACRSFQPYQGPGSCPATRPISENGGNQTVVPNGSPIRSSPAFSDNGSTSQQGGGSSSDTGSLSNHCKQEQSAPCETREDHRHPEHSVSSSNHMIGSKSPNNKEMVTLPAIIQSNQTKPDIQPQPVKKPEMPELQPDKQVTPQGPRSVPLRLASQDLGKPPKPETRRPENQTQNVPSFSQMPCVSTTGNGPNGKTITGFLYRYTKSEVSIICVCHGSSFSPAEFVEHAGGTDVTNPLKHITVIPSAF